MRASSILPRYFSRGYVLCKTQSPVFTDRYVAITRCFSGKQCALVRRVRIRLPNVARNCSVRHLALTKFLANDKYSLTFVKSEKKREKENIDGISVALILTLSCRRRMKIVKFNSDTHNVSNYAPASGRTEVHFVATNRS